MTSSSEKILAPNPFDYDTKARIHGYKKKSLG